MACILLSDGIMFENEIVRVVEMRFHARGNRPLLARIDRVLHLLTQARLSGEIADLDMLLREIDALAEEIDRLRA